MLVMIKNVMSMYHNDNYFLSKRVYRKVSCFWPLSLFLAQSFYTSPCQYPNTIKTVWHEIFAGSKFCDFFSDPQKQVPANKNYRKHFFRKNLLQSEYSLLNSLHKKYSTKKSCVFNYNVRLLFRDKTVYNELLV